jgi:pimeloyl-ACP methyl ester carboxylesterase
MKATANGIEIEYEAHGDENDPPLLLIMGLGAQLTMWRDDFVKELVGEGFRVIRYDNRDVGLSTWFDEAGLPDLAQALATGAQVEPAYSLADMADDAAALLDALGLPKAHIVGASMGGMIAQTFAIRHPEKTLSLCSIMSTTGNPEVGQPDPELIAGMLLAAPPTTVEEAEEASVLATKLIGNPSYPADEAETRAYARAAYERAFHPAGTGRQLLAIVNQPDRTADLANVTAPTLVIHGDSDTLVNPSGGQATANAVPNAEFWMQEGVGHDIPPELYTATAARIAHNARRAS